MLNYSIETDAKAVQRTLEVDPKGVELILGLISKTVPQAASAKPEDFYDARFFTELKDSGFLETVVGRKLPNNLKISVAYWLSKIAKEMTREKPSPEQRRRARQGS